MASTEGEPPGAVHLKIGGHDVEFPFKPYASQLVSVRSRSLKTMHPGVLQPRLGRSGEESRVGFQRQRRRSPEACSALRGGGGGGGGVGGRGGSGGCPASAGCACQNVEK